jgi:hypothetical protein
MNRGGLQLGLLGRRGRRRRFSPIEGVYVNVRIGTVRVGMRGWTRRDGLPWLCLGCRLSRRGLVLDEVMDTSRNSELLINRADFLLSRIHMLLSRIDMVTVTLPKVIDRRDHTSRVRYRHRGWILMEIPSGPQRGLFLCQSRSIGRALGASRIPRALRTVRNRRRQLREARLQLVVVIGSPRSCRSRLTGVPSPAIVGSADSQPGNGDARLA